MDPRMTVEVQGLFGQFYPALVTSFSDGDYINLVIGQCEEVKRVHLTNMRLPPVSRQSPECKFSSGDAVEAFCKLPTELITTASANDPELAATLQNEALFGDAWWQAKVREIKGSFAVVLLSLRVGPPNGTVMQQQAEIVELDKLRPVNTQPMLTGKSVHRFSILLGSDDVLDFYATTQHDLNKDLRERCGGALLVSYNRETKSIDFQSLNERVIQKVEMLADTHERRIRELFRLDEQTKRMYGMSLNSTSRPGAISSANFIDEFVVSQSVLSAALQNIPKARKLDGITAIDVDKDSGRFRVAGEREEAVRDARNLLEFVEVTIGVPAVYASRIIGRLGANIQRIVDKSNVLRVSVLGEADRAAATSGSDPNATGVNAGDVPFRFMGSREAIDNARMMLEYRIETLREFDRLRAGLTTGTPSSISAAQQFGDVHSLPANSANSLLVGTALPSGTPPSGEPSSSTSGFNTGGSTASVNTVGRSHNTFRNASSSAERDDAELGTHYRPTLHGRGVTSTSGSRRAAYPDSDGVYDHGVPYGNADAARHNHGTNTLRQATSAGVSRSRNQPGQPYRNGSGRRSEAYATATNGELGASAKQTQSSTRDGGYGTSSSRNQDEQKANGNTAPAATKKQPTASVTEGGDSQQQRRSGNSSGSNARRRRRPPADANAVGTNGNDQAAVLAETK